MSNCCGFKPFGRCAVSEGSSTFAVFPARIDPGLAELAEFPARTEPGLAEIAEFLARIDRRLAEAAGRLIGRLGCKWWYFPRPLQPELRRRCIRCEMRSNRLSICDVGSALITEGTSLGKLYTALWAKGHCWPVRVPLSSPVYPCVQTCRHFMSAPS